MRRRSVCALLWGLVLVAPAAALRLPADAGTKPIHPGAVRFSIRRPSVPIAIDGFVWDRSQAALSLDVSVGRGAVHGLEPVSGQIKQLLAPPQRPIAAVNGDFFVMRGHGAGATIGLFVRQGELFSLGNRRPALVVLADGQPRIEEFTTALQLHGPGGIVLTVNRLNNERGPGSLVCYTPAWGPSTGANEHGVEVTLAWQATLSPNQTAPAMVVGGPFEGLGNAPIPTDGFILSGHGPAAEALRRLSPGMVLTVETKTTPELPIDCAIGGGPVLVRNGRPVPKTGSDPRHPRTAVGFDGKQIVCVTVDGRRQGYSRGMTIAELTALMQGLGCTEAINLDGGGSTTCWVHGSILNRPSDGRERSVANALALLTNLPVGQPHAVLFDAPETLRVTAGATYRPKLAVIDANDTPLGDTTTAALSLEGGVGEIRNGAFIAGAKAGRGVLVAKVGEAEGRLPLEVVAQVAELVAEPSRIEVVGNDAVRLTIEGRAADGTPIEIAPTQLSWQLPTGWRRAPDGQVTATDDAADGELRVSGYGALAKVPLAKARPVAIEDFEQDLSETSYGYPETVTGSLSRLTGEAASGQHFARLQYALGTTPPTRAVYLKLDHPLGAALALRAKVRAEGGRYWLRAAVVDGNGIRTTHTLYDGELNGGWTTVSTDLPTGLKPPLVWQSVYYVATRPEMPVEGYLDWDRLEALEVSRPE